MIINSKKWNFLKNWIMKETKWMDNNNLTTRLWYIINNKHEYVRCKTCGKQITRNIFTIKTPFVDFCSFKCRGVDNNQKEKARITRYIKNNGRWESRETTIKRKETFKEHYNGIDNNMKSPEGYKKYVDSILENWGVQNVFQDEGIKKKSNEKKLEKYGNLNNFDKTKETNMKLYNVPYFVLSKFFKNGASKYIYDNLYFHSSWELITYLYFKINDIKFIFHPDETLTYIDSSGLQHKYHPDFKLIDFNRFIEVKGDHFLIGGDLKNGMFCPYNSKLNIKEMGRYKCML